MYVVVPHAVPSALATPMGVQLLDELVTDLVQGKGHFPTEQELSGVGIDGYTVVFNYMAAQYIHDELLGRGFDPRTEEQRIWSRIPTSNWTAQLRRT
jgi:hypothetical protein